MLSLALLLGAGDEHPAVAFWCKQNERWRVNVEGSFAGLVVRVELHRPSPVSDVTVRDGVGAAVELLPKKYTLRVTPDDEPVEICLLRRTEHSPSRIVPPQLTRRRARRPTLEPVMPFVWLQCCIPPL